MVRGALPLLALWLTAASARADCDDPALTRAAAEIVATGARNPRALARAAGSALPLVRGLRVREGDDDGVRRFLAALAEEAHAPIACGEASSEGRRVVLAGPRAAEVAVEDGAVTIRLAHGWGAPRLYVRDGAGNTHEGDFVEGRAELPSDLSAPLVIQVVATGPDGPRPVAEQTVGEVPLASVARSDEPIDRRVARLRSASRVSALRPNRLLERVAARHAAEVCRDGRVAHVGDGGDPVERLAREGIRARHVGVTVARATDLDAAYAAMLQSPSHRAALVDARMTDVGVGRASDRCLVVLLAAWPRPVPF